MTDYTTTVKPIEQVTAADREAMIGLYLKYYDGSSAAQVVTDLENKSEVLLLFYDDILVGFTTLLIYDHLWQGRNVRIVFSGDTIVDREHWGQQALAFAWITRMGQIAARDVQMPLYWFVIIKGHRTYKYLPTFGKSFYPHWAIDRSDLKPLADELAVARFGRAYNAQTGIVEFEQSQGHLKEDIAYASEEELNKESVRFFFERNPHYLKGHEMVCLCEISLENMKPLTKRIFLRGRDG